MSLKRRQGRGPHCFVNLPKRHLLGLCFPNAAWKLVYVTSNTLQWFLAGREVVNHFDAPKKQDSGSQPLSHCAPLARNFLSPIP
ncbi:hypothetical protein FKM82_007983 [Ascaphus truei]